MAIFMVSKVEDINRNIIGIGLVGVTDGRTHEFKIVPLKQAIEVIGKKLVEVENVDSIDGKLYGNNGSIDRYPTIDTQGNLLSETKLTVLYKIVSNGKIIGFWVSDHKGQISSINYAQIVELGVRTRITNGKIVKFEQGGYTISALSGSYKAIEIEEEHKNIEQNAYEAVMANSVKQGGFDRTNVRVVVEDIKKALAEVENKYSVRFSVEPTKFSDSSFSCKLDCVKSLNGKSAEQILFEKYAASYGFRPEHFGKTFVSRDKTYRISGVSPKSYKRPILATDINGSVYKFTPQSVKRLIEP